MDFIAGPINAALGENKSIEVFGEDVLHAIDVEAREIQHPIIARIRNETDVVAQPRDIDDWLFFVLVFIDRGKADAAIGRSQAVLHRDPVSAEKFNRHTGDRLAGLDRSDKDIAAVIGILFHEQAEIADQNEARGGSRLDVFLRSGSQPLAFRKKRPRSLPPSAGFCRCREKSNAE